MQRCIHGPIAADACIFVAGVEEEEGDIVEGEGGGEVERGVAVVGEVRVLE